MSGTNNETKPKTSKYIIANGNGGMFKQFLPLLKGKWGFGFAIIAWVYALAYLPPEQTDNFLRFAPFFESRLGLALIVVGGIVIIIQAIVRPVIDTAVGCFDRYMDKESKRIEILTEIKQGINDLEQIVNGEFVTLLRQLLEQSQKNYKGIKMIWDHTQKGGN